jgi:hypothetical protein
VRTRTGQLALLSASVLRPLFGWRAGADGEVEKEGGVDERRLFGQVYVPPDERRGRHGAEFAEVMTARVTSAPAVVFLGVLAPAPSSPNQNPNQDQSGVHVGEGVDGVPYFALDVAGTGREQDVLRLKIDGDDSEVAWGPARFVSPSFTREDAAIFGEARSMLDWNGRNKVRSCLPLLLNVIDGDGDW